MVAYRRERGDMPALRDEIEEALDEGIDLRTQLQPLRLVGGDHKGLLCVRTEPGPPDDSGRRRPQVVAGSEVLAPSDGAGQLERALDVLARVDFSLDAPAPAPPVSPESCVLVSVDWRPGFGDVLAVGRGARLGHGEPA